MNRNLIDLRSDTVTAPCDGMRRAMAAAEVGDDVYDEDPTVKRLQARLAEMAEHEAGLFFPSGTQSNLAALLSHCQRGEEYIVGQEAHTYKYEGGGAAVLGSIQPQPIELSADGTMPLEKIRSAIKEDDFHFPVTRLLALDPNPGMGRRARPRIEASRIRVEPVSPEDGARLPLEDASVESVVSTWTLCSVRRVEMTLAEIGRVLRPGGIVLQVNVNRGSMFSTVFEQIPSPSRSPGSYVVL